MSRSHRRTSCPASNFVSNVTGSSIHPSIHPCIQYGLSAYCAPSTVLDSEDKWKTKNDTDPGLMTLMVSAWRHEPQEKAFCKSHLEEAAHASLLVLRQEHSPRKIASFD